MNRRCISRIFKSIVPCSGRGTVSDEGLLFVYICFKYEYTDAVKS
jgi:hypothetical protein